MVALLELCPPKVKVVEMDHKLFMPKILGGLEEVMDAMSFGLCIPRPHDLECLLVSSKEVNLYPFILDIEGEVLHKHREKTEMAVSFLKKMLHVELVQ
jgi:hypothetical protein